MSEQATTDRIGEIESAIAQGEMSASQVFTQMRQLTQPQSVVPEGKAMVPLKLASNLAIRLGGYGVDELFAQTRVDAIAELNQILDGTWVLARCKWRSDVGGCWTSDCGKEWWFNEGGPDDNGMLFCVKCGSPCVELGGSDLEDGSYDNAM